MSIFLIFKNFSVVTSVLCFNVSEIKGIFFLTFIDVSLFLVNNAIKLSLKVRDSLRNDFISVQTSWSILTQTKQAMTSLGDTVCGTTVLHKEL